MARMGGGLGLDAGSARTRGGSSAAMVGGGPRGKRGSWPERDGTRADRGALGWVVLQALLSIRR